MYSAKRLGFAGVLLLLISGCVNHTSNKSPNIGSKASTSIKVPKYSAEAFFKTKSYSMANSAGYAFSNDGNYVLMSSDQSGVFNVYAAPVNGGEPIALTESTTDATFGVSYFPEDDRLLFTRDTGGDELDHLFVRETNGRTKDLTPGEKVKASFMAWSADGAKFWVLSNERDPRSFDVYEYSSNDYSRSLVFENAGFQPADISRDGRWLALEKPRTSADSNVFLVDLATTNKAPELITEHSGNISYSVHGFTMDGAKLVYSTDEFGEFVQAWSHDLDSGSNALLEKADWDVSFVTFSPSGRYRVVGVNDDARTKVTIFDSKTSQQQSLGDLPAGDLGQIRFARDESKVALRLSSDTSPANVYVVNMASKQSIRLTDSLNPAINAEYLVESEIVRYPSFDELAIPSVFYKPKQASAANKVPALVLVHGGPGGQSRQGYRALVQHLVNHGYAVLAANNRGSSGYGKTFFHLDDKRHGEVDLQDIVYARKYLETLDWVDADKIGIIGGSYGGYMVAAALAFEPDVFDVGVNIFGVTNWERTLLSIPPWWESFKEALYDEMGDPATDLERLRRISPLFHAENIKKPLLVVQGANDPRVLQAESDDLVAAVRKNKVPVKYVLFPDEGHGFLKKENRITASNAYVECLDRRMLEIFAGKLDNNQRRQQAGRPISILGGHNTAQRERHVPTFVREAL